MLSGQVLPNYENAVNEVLEIEANVDDLKLLKSLFEKVIANEGIIFKKEMAYNNEHGIKFILLKTPSGVKVFFDSINQLPIFLF